MTEASLAIARKVVMCAGLLVSALLFLYPHWRVSFAYPRIIDYDLGRGFITAPPIPEPSQLVRLAGMESIATDAQALFMSVNMVKASCRVHRVRQLTEVALALLLTLGLIRALKKPTGD